MIGGAIMYPDVKNKLLFIMNAEIRKGFLNQEHLEIRNIWQSYAEVKNKCSAKSRYNINPLLLNLLNQSPCVTWILDIRAREFDFISCNTFEFFGYDTAYYNKEGQSFHESKKHPDDRLVVEKLLKKIEDILVSVSASEQVNYKYSYDYRIVKPDGKEVRILEQNSVFQQDSDGNITHLLGVCTDITHWKKGELQLASLTSELHKKYYLLSADTISSGKSLTVLSRRELEIAKLMAEGRSSKYIADKLFISFHTVNTHRKNMIEKTKTKNTCGLVQFVVGNGLI